MEVNECIMPPEPDAPICSEPDEPEKPKRKRVRVRFSMFFDGTANNMTNTQTRLDGELGKDPAGKGVYKRTLDSDTFRESSYFNDFSNVARLYKNADTSASGYDHYFRIYTEGIGTLDDEEDSTLGNVSGRGDTGVVAKVSKGLANLLTRLARTLRPDQYSLELVTIDTFGFSRGATAARHCVHRVLHSGSKGKPSLKQRLEALGYEVEKVEVKAVGLYDTVSALGVAYIDISDVEELHLDAVRDAQAVYHLAAAEEYRICFSLTNIDSAVSAGKGCEIFLPGAHSDVGGGYVNGGGENKPLWTGDGSEALLEYLDTYGWATHEQARIVGALDAKSRRDDIWPVRPDKQGRAMKPLQAHLISADRYVKMERKPISNRYSFIPLQLMAEFAREQGLSILTDLEKEYDPCKGPLGMTSNMVAKIMAYAKRVKGTRDSIAEDWQRREETLNQFRNNYLHFSSGSSAGLNLRARLWEDFLDPWRRVYSDTA